MDFDTQQRVLSALRHWVVVHPNPAEPVIRFGSERHPNGLSPKQIVEEIEAHTQDGDFLLKMIDFSIREFGESTILDGFRIDEGTRGAFLASAH
jgi:hypothetical protein